MANKKVQVYLTAPAVDALNKYAEATGLRNGSALSALVMSHPDIKARVESDRRAAEREARKPIKPQPKPAPDPLWLVKSMRSTLENMDRAKRYAFLAERDQLEQWYELTRDRLERP